MNALQPERIGNASGTIRERHGDKMGTQTDPKKQHDREVNAREGPRLRGRIGRRARERVAVSLGYGCPQTSGMGDRGPRR